MLTFSAVDVHGNNHNGIECIWCVGFLILVFRVINLKIYQASAINLINGCPSTMKRRNPCGWCLAWEFRNGNRCSKIHQSAQNEKDVHGLYYFKWIFTSSILSSIPSWNPLSMIQDMKGLVIFIEMFTVISNLLE